MRKKIKKGEREAKIAKGIMLAWSSLESHLDFTHRASSEGCHFHKQCVREYAEIIKILSELY